MSWNLCNLLLCYFSQECPSVHPVPPVLRPLACAVRRGAPRSLQSAYARSLGTVGSVRTYGA